jgi:hypothetical protein
MIERIAGALLLVPAIALAKWGSRALPNSGVLGAGRIGRTIGMPRLNLAFVKWALVAIIALFGLTFLIGTTPN